MAENTEQEGVPVAFKIGMGIIIAAGLITGGVVTYNYFKSKKEIDDSSKSSGSNDTTTQNTAPTQPLKTASGKTDYTALPSGKTVYATSPDSKGDLKLGQDITVRGGATVQRMDEGLAKQGNTVLTSDTALGTAWHLGFPSTTIVRAKAGFGYPFYLVSNSDINQKGSLLSKVGAEISKIL